jgi:nucleoside-diphosphate-sugar epimerase
MIHVTGANGFIGQAVISYCKSHGFEVRGYSRNPSISQENIFYVENYSLIPRDGILIHLGEHSHIASINEQVIQQQLATAKAVAEMDHRHKLYISSAAVFLPSDQPIKTESQDFSQSLYAQGKLMCEQIFLSRSGSVARLSNVFGPGMSRDNVLSAILQQRNAKLLRLQNLRPIRDYIWIDDVASALVALTIQKFGEIFHVSTGQGTSVRELVQTVCLAAGNLDYQIEETKPGSGSTLILDPSKIEAHTKWRRKETLKSGIKKMMGYS